MASNQDWPKAKTEGFVAQRLDDELVVYDESTQTAHSLSAVAAQVWEHCDGELTPAEIADAVGLAPELVERAVRELRECELLEPPSGYSRREATIRFAKIGGVAFAAPLIYSVAIGPATAAASCTAAGGTCSTGATCCTGTCTAGHCACSANQGTCSTTADCCTAGAECTGSKCCCANGVVSCCSVPADCCTGTKCVSGKCEA